MAGRIATYAEFWHYYLGEHSKPGTRALHYAGSALALSVLAYAIAANFWALALVPIAGYALAWTGHGFVEHNRPVTFKYPWWSLISDYRMFGLWLTGRLGPHLARAGVVDEVAPASSTDQQPAESSVRSAPRPHIDGRKTHSSVKAE